MSLTQTAPAGPAQQPPAAPPGLPDQPRTSPVGALGGRLRSWLSGTPGRMRQLLIAGAVVAIVFGFAASQGFSEASGALERADANAAQLVRIQAIHTNLASADANATNAFLRGGIEPAKQRTDYDDGLATASRLIAEAARAQPADNQALAALNRVVLDYAGLIEQARANNRQALPVGAQYLRVASANLRTDALPLLQNLVQANQDRVTLEFDRITRGFIWLSVAGLVTLAIFGVALMWLARRTHRYVNLPLAIGGIAVLLTTVMGAIGLWNVGAKVDDIRDGPYSATLALAQARIAAYDAKSNESLTLISRGSGQAFEKAWTTSFGKVTTELNRAVPLTDTASQLPEIWQKYGTTHKAIRASDDGGRWDAAVDQAIGTQAGGTNDIFASFDQSSADALAATGEQTRAGLGDAGDTLPLARWLSLVVGLVAALCVWWGVSQRLEEYR